MKMKYKVTFISKNESDNILTSSLEKAIRHICYSLNKQVGELTQVPISSKQGADYIYHCDTHIVAVITRIIE